MHLIIFPPFLPSFPLPFCFLSFIPLFPHPSFFYFFSFFLHHYLLFFLEMGEIVTETQRQLKVTLTYLYILNCLISLGPSRIGAKPQECITLGRERIKYLGMLAKSGLSK